MLRPSSNPAHSAFMKIARAKANMESLGKEIHDTRFVDGYGVKFREHPDTGEITITLSHAKYRSGWGINQRGPRADHWPAIVGEIVHDLRSALDHLVFQLSVQVNPGRYQQADPSFEPNMWRRIAFPVSTSRDSFNASTGQQLWALERTPFISFIEEQQPFVRNPQAPSETLLWRLNELWNIDKHRSITVLSGLVKLNKIRVSDVTKDIRENAVGWQPFQEGVDLARLPSGSAQGKIGIEPNGGLALDVALGDHGDVQKPLLHTLGDLRTEVKRILDDFQDLYYS